MVLPHKGRGQGECLGMTKRPLYFRILCSTVNPFNGELPAATAELGVVPQYHCQWHAGTQSSVGCELLPKPQIHRTTLLL